MRALLDQIRACRVCRDAPRGRPLPHEPRPVLQLSATGAPLLLCGQAPGTRVHASGRPFTDASGERLRAWLSLSEADFYDDAKVAIVPMGFCFPGQDGRGGDIPPRPECAATWHDLLFAALPPPRLTVTLGAPALRYHLARLGRADLLRPKMDDMVADWQAILDAARLLPLPHPSWRNSGWLRRNAWFEAELLPVLRDEVSRALHPPG